MAKRRLREEGAIDRICMLVVWNKNLNLPEDEFNAMCKTEEVRKQAIFNLNVVDLESRLMEEYGGTRDVFFCKEEALYLMENIPEELIVNVEEWLDEKSLSDIKIHGVSVNDVFEMCKGRFIHFLSILKCFIEWKKTGYEDPDFCFWYFGRA
jgi:hypothetical protein